VFNPEARHVRAFCWQISCSQNPLPDTVLSVSHPDMLFHDFQYPVIQDAQTGEQVRALEHGKAYANMRVGDERKPGKLVFRDSAKLDAGVCLWPEAS